MNSLSDIPVFAMVLAINLFLYGSLLAGGLAVVLRFTENIGPRIRYLFSIVVFLTAVGVPFAATIFDNSVKGKAVGSYAESESKQETDSSRQLSQFPLRPNFDKNSSQPAAETSDGNLINKLVLILIDSSVIIILSVIWIFGSVLLFLRMVSGFRRLARSKKRWALASVGERESLNCPKEVALFLADDQTPGTVGWLRSSIVLPKTFPAAISASAKCFVVRHELAHARWHDPLARFLLRTIRNLFWISPALWFIERLIASESEAAADRAAINVSNSNENSQEFALSYAETLLLIVISFDSAKHRNRQSPLVGIGAESELEIRIRRLLSSRRTTRRQLASAICACFLTAVTMAFIPVASLSEIIQGTNSENDFFADDQKSFATVENSNAPIFANEPIILPQTESVEEPDRSIRSKTPLKKSTNQNSTLTDELLMRNLRENRANSLDSILSNRDDDNTVSAKALSEEDAAQAELRVNQQAAERLNDLEPLPASRGLNDELNALQKIRPASERRTALPDADKLARQKAASELDRRRTYQVNYPKPTIAVPKLETYEPRYVSYPAKRGEQ